MNLLLEIEEQYVVEDIIDHCSFVGALPILLGASDIVVFGTYGSRADVHEFLSAHQMEPDAFVRGARRTFQIWKEEYPNGTAFGLRADPLVLRQLVALLGSKSVATDLCDHIVAYSSELPLLSFHDAFKSDPCYLTSKLPKAQVEAFCRAIGKSYSLQLVPEPLA